MATVQQCLISARFITTMGHFIALLLLFSTIDNNIDESLGDNYASGEKQMATDTTWVKLHYCLLVANRCSQFYT